ncbi:MAG: ATP-grasp domain-containing protein, partial [Saprospiraceae bacterium]
MYFKPKDIKIGILGGGQLAKMIHQESMSLDISIHFMDDSLVCPVAKVSPNFTLGNIQNFDDVYNFGKDKEIVSIEIENVNIEALKALESIGIQVYPKPEVLEMIQDKGLQKEFLIQNNFPTSPYTFCSSIVELKESILQGKLKYPFVQKLRKGGYDGRGVCIVKSESELFKLLDGESIIEELALIEQEISVIAVRSIHGECKTYPSVSMVFHSVANLVEYLICPSNISIEKEAIAQKIAME